MLLDGIDKILVYEGRVDMRKSFNGLLSLIKHELKEDPFSQTLFVFCNRRGNYLKALYWDRTGYCILAKRLEKGSFNADSSRRELELGMFQLFFDGIKV